MTYYSAPGIVRELTNQTLNKIFDSPTWEKYPNKYCGRGIEGHKVVLKKSAAMYVLRKDYNLTKLAELFGYRNHTTALKNIRNFKSWLDVKDQCAIKALEDARMLLFKSRVIYK